MAKKASSETVRSRRSGSMKCVRRPRIYSRVKLPRPQQQGLQRRPKLAFRSHVMADKVVQELVNAGNMQMRLLAALAAKFSGNRRLAVVAGAGRLGTDGACARAKM